MDKKIEEVIDDIAMVFNEAKISDYKDKLHVLIAYFRAKEIKTEEDYAINAVVAVLINDVLKYIKEDKIELAKNEISILCKAIMMHDVSENEFIDVKNQVETKDSEVKNNFVVEI